jgi:hypothetical protein
MASSPGPKLAHGKTPNGSLIARSDEIRPVLDRDPLYDIIIRKQRVSFQMFTKT